MRAGQLREVARLLNPGTTENDFNTDTGYEVTCQHLRVGVRPLNGKELRAAQQDGSEVTAEISVRYRSDITGASRLEVSGVTYEVMYAINVRNRNRDLRLQCKVVT